MGVSLADAIGMGGVPRQTWDGHSERRGCPWWGEGGTAAACRPAWGRRGGGLWRVPTWFLACLYRVCFKVSESKVELSTSLTSNASSAALRRSSPFPKVGIGSKANRPPGRSSTHLHQRPERGLPLAGLASRHLSDAPQLAPCLHARHGISTGHVHEETDTRTHGHLDGSHMDAGERQREMSTCTHCKEQAGRLGLRDGGQPGTPRFPRIWVALERPGAPAPSAQGWEETGRLGKASGIYGPPPGGSWNAGSLTGAESRQ